MNTKDFIAIEEQYGAHNYHPLDVVIERAEGVWVYDVDGKRYLDCLSAYSAVNQGHVHPQILNALLEQAKKVTLTSRAFRNDQLPLLYKELSEMTGYEMSLPMNSGAEAVETAIKLARKWAYQVNAQLVSEADKDVIVMHCLPAHRNHELTDDVADGPHSVIFPQAHNRLHAQKAILARLFEVA